MNKQQKRNIFIIERLLLGAGPGAVTNWLAPHDRAIIRRFLGHVKELEQQRDAALKLADELRKDCVHLMQAADVPNEKIAKPYGGSMLFKIDELRAIFAPKEGK